LTEKTKNTEVNMDGVDDYNNHLKEFETKGTNNSEKIL